MLNAKTKIKTNPNLQKYRTRTLSKYTGYTGLQAQCKATASTPNLRFRRSISGEMGLKFSVGGTKKKLRKQIQERYVKTLPATEIQCLEHQIEREFSKIFQKTVLTVFLIAKDDKVLFKKNMHKLLDNPSSNKIQVDINLDLLYKTLSKLYKNNKSSQTSTSTNKMDDAETGINNQAGGVMPAGPYLQRLTTIGDQPITGNDMAKAISEIITVLNDLQYLQQDGGPNIRGFNVLLNYFNGDTENMKYFLRYYFAPQFYHGSPPFLRFDEIGKRLDNIIDFLNIYKNDKRVKAEFAVETGVKPESVLQDTFADKLINKWDKLDQDYNRFNRYRKLQFF